MKDKLETGNEAEKKQVYSFTNRKKSGYRVVYLGYFNAIVNSFFTQGIDGNLLSLEETTSTPQATEFFYECPTERKDIGFILDGYLLPNPSIEFPMEEYLQELRQEGFLLYSVSRGYHRPYQCCVMAFDVTSRKSFESMVPVHTHFSTYQADRSEEMTAKFVVIGTVPSTESPREISSLEAERFASSWGCPYFEIKEDSSHEILRSLQDTIIKLCQEDLTSEEAVRQERYRQYRKRQEKARKKKLMRCTIM